MSKAKEDQAKLKWQSIPLDVKLQVLDHLDKGKCQVDIGADLKLATSIIRTIPKNKEKIKLSATTSTSSSTKKITQTRCYTLEEMEKRLSIWTDIEVECNMPLSQDITMEKAKSIYSHIRAQIPDELLSHKGWFDRFRKRNNPCNIKITEEEAIADIKAAEACPAKLREIVERGSYPPDLVFNVDETGLFWKRMLS
ncbi:tigger transposable element-derived protein 1-like [Discoglossus pictus]